MYGSCEREPERACRRLTGCCRLMSDYEVTLVNDNSAFSHSQSRILTCLQLTLLFSSVSPSNQRNTSRVHSPRSDTDTQLLDPGRSSTLSSRVQQKVCCLCTLLSSRLPRTLADAFINTQHPSKAASGKSTLSSPTSTPTSRPVSAS